MVSYFTWVKPPDRVLERKVYCLEIEERLKIPPLNERGLGVRTVNSATIRSSKKIFTEEEAVGVTGICLEHLRSLARSKHLGVLVRAAEAAGGQAEKILFSTSDLMVLRVLQPRCEH